MEQAPREATNERVKERRSMKYKVDKVTTKGDQKRLTTKGFKQKKNEVVEEKSIADDKSYKEKWDMIIVRGVSLGKSPIVYLKRSQGKDPSLDHLRAAVWAAAAGGGM